MSVSDLQILIGILVLYVTAVLVAWKYFRYKMRQREEREGKFVEILLRALRESSLRKIKDVHDLYLAFFKGREPQTIDHELVALFLRRAKLCIVSETLPFGLKREDALNTMETLLDESTIAVEKQKERIPFSGVPSPERALLEDILEIIGTDQRQILRDRFGELASAIKARQETIERLSDEKNRSVKLAKLGISLTVLFSLISVGLTIWLSLK